MTDLTDYEINRRLAEIAGVRLYAKRDESGLCRIKPPPDLGSGLWKPLTDWSQLGPLMEAHVLRAERHPYDNPGQEWRVDCGSGGHGLGTGLKHAICLAILAAHEESNPRQDDEPSSDVASGAVDQDAIKGEA